MSLRRTSGKFQQVPSSLVARALEFTILTAARTSEAIEAKEGEIDFANKLWTVPAERMKANKEHRVPLPERAIEILQTTLREKGSEWMFPGGRKGRPLSNMAMLELLRDMAPGLTVHGFRSTRSMSRDQLATHRKNLRARRAARAAAIDFYHEKVQSFRGVATSEVLDKVRGLWLPTQKV
jgi:integrase